MADFTQTITNEFQLFGAEPTNLWGTMEWGNDNWGYGSDVVVHIEKILDSQDLTLTTALNFDATNLITNSLTMTTAMDELFLVDSEGFYHVFTGNTTEGENRVMTDYTEAGAAGGDWSEQSPPSTSWS